MKKISKIIGFSFLLMVFIVGNLLVSYSFEKQDDATLKLLISQSIANSEEYGNDHYGSCITCVSPWGYVGVEIICQYLPGYLCNDIPCNGGFCN